MSNTPLIGFCWWWFGASTASFLGVVAERGWAGAARTKRSQCVCSRQLLWWENVPVLGFLVLGGKARCCGAKIPLRYFLTECFLGAISLCGVFSPKLGVIAILVGGYVVLSVSRRMSHSS